MSTEHTPGAPLGRAMTAEEFNAACEEFNGIMVIVEVGEDGDRWAAYGHQDKEQMTKAVLLYMEEISGDPDFWASAPPSAADVEHVWWVNTAWRGEDDEWRCEPASAGNPAAFPVTVVRV